jgi:hypothetical protein
VSVTVWRRTLLWLCAFAIVQSGVAWWMSVSVVARTGAFARYAATPFRWPLIVEPGSAAAKAGLQTGDVVDATAFSPGDRYRFWTHMFQKGTRVTVPVVRGARVVPLMVEPEVLPKEDWTETAGWIGGFWAFFFAAFLAWRRSASAEARALVLVLLLPNLALDLLPVNWITPWVGWDVFATVLSNLSSAGWVLVATYALLLPPRPGLLRRSLAWIAYALTGASVAIGIAGALAYTGVLDPQHVLIGAPLLDVITPLAYSVPLLCAFATIVETRGAARERIGWVTASMLPIYAGVIGAIIVNIAGLFALRPLMSAIANIGIFVAPLGLTYAMVNRRLLDLSFAINRAVVFAGVSVVVVGIFVLAEWAFSEWFSEASHTTNALVSAGLALVLGFSVRAIHSRVDSLLDNLFFRKRHEDEQALRTFGREAPFITDARTLFERTTACLEERAGASTVTIAIDDGEGHYGALDENDPALVALRATHDVVDLRAVDSRIPGEFAYPMFARGRVLGAIVIGPKRSGESYAPDESAAIEAVAGGVADAVDLLALSNGRSRDAILDGIRAIQATLHDMGERLGTKAPLAE